MSGAEAGLVLGLISSIISIIDAAYEIYTLANDSKKLPKRCRAAADQLPMVSDILDTAKRNIGAGKAGEESLKSITSALEDCKKIADTLKKIFDENIPLKDDSRTDRYGKAVRLKLKSGEIKEYMETMLQKLDLLAKHQIFVDAQTISDIEEAITELANMPDNDDEDVQSSYTHSGSGNLNSNTGSGDQNNQSVEGTNNKQWNAKTQHFGGETNHNYVGEPQAPPTTKSAGP